jgi:hypothetical protein
VRCKECNTLTAAKAAECGHGREGAPTATPCAHQTHVTDTDTDTDTVTGSRLPSGSHSDRHCHDQRVTPRDLAEQCLENVPARLADMPRQPHPTIPVRPIALNGASGTLEGRTRRTLRQLLYAHISPLLPHRDAEAMLLRALAIVSITCIRGFRAEASRRLANIAKFGPSPATLKRRDMRKKKALISLAAVADAAARN